MTAARSGSEAPGRRHSAYTLDGGEEDLQRLLGIARVSEDMTRRGLARSDLGPGGRALDCGCGPLGALPILAEIVGPGGDVVGVDSNADAIQVASSTLVALGVSGAQLLASDVGELDVDAVDGPLDLVYARCFLMHQPDPDAVVSRLASLLRPGGWLVCHEPLPTPAPWSHPDHPDLGPAWDLLHTVVRSSGVAVDAVATLPDVLVTSGFEVEHVGTTSTLMPPDVGFQLHAQTTAAIKARAEAIDAEAARQADALAASLLAARDDDAYRWVSTPVYLDVGARRT